MRQLGKWFALTVFLFATPLSQLSAAPMSELDSLILPAVVLCNEEGTPDNDEKSSRNRADHVSRFIDLFNKGQVDAIRETTQGFVDERILQSHQQLTLSAISKAEVQSAVDRFADDAIAEVAKLGKTLRNADLAELRVYQSRLKIAWTKTREIAKEARVEVTTARYLPAKQLSDPQARVIVFFTSDAGIVMVTTLDELAEEVDLDRGEIRDREAMIGILRVLQIQIQRGERAATAESSANIVAANGTVASPDPKQVELVPRTALSRSMDQIGMTCEAGGEALDLTGGFGGVKNDRLESLAPRAATLKALIIHQSLITDEGFRHLTALTELRSLTIGVHPNAVPGQSLGDEALGHLVGLKKLECLSLSAQRVTEKGLAHLKQLPNLRRLNLNLGCEAEHADRIHSRSLGRGGLPPPNLSDEALSRLADLEQLEQLNLADYSFPSDGLRHLTRLKNLKALSLAFTNVDDEAIQHLAELQHLEELDLSETGITPQGLERFSHLKNLRVIGLTGSRLIARGENHLIHWLHATERDIWSELPQLAPASPASIVTHVDLVTGVIKELVRDDRWQGSMPDEFGREPIIDQRIQAVLSDKQHCFVLVTSAAGHRENLKSGHTVTRHEKLTCSIYVFRLRDGSSAKIWQVPVDSAPVARVSASTLAQVFRLVEGGVTCNGAKFLMKEDEEATQSD